MRILSTNLKLSQDFGEDDLYSILFKWLHGNSQYRVLCEVAMPEIKKDVAKIEAGYCTIEKFTAEQDGDKFLLFKLTHKFYSQIWETEVIYRFNVREKSILIHINCSGDTSLFDDVPRMRTDIIRCFVNSGKLQPTYLPITDKPIYLSDDRVKWLAGVINGKYDYDLPLIFVSKIFNTLGHEIDVERVAEKLAGVAYVLVEDKDDFANSLKDITDGRNPYNGYVGVYSKGNYSCKKFHPSDAEHSVSLDRHIMNYVVKYVTSQAEALKISWDIFNNEKFANRANDSEALLGEAMGENLSLAEQLKLAKEKIHQLTQINMSLNAQKEALQNALREDIKGRLIVSANIPEFFDGEQYDLIVTILTKALANYRENTRSYDLLKGILENNQLTGNGKQIEKVVKSVLSAGENPKEKDFARLKEVGFDVVSDNMHYKLVYRGDDRYTFSLSKTPSDRQHSGKNAASEIFGKISVYN